MKSILFTLFIISQSVYSSSSNSILILDEIKKSIAVEYGLQDEFVTVEETVIEEKKINKVQSKIDELKMKEQKRLGLPTDRVLSGAERVELLKKKNRENIALKKNDQAPVDWFDSKKAEVDNWQNEKLKQLKIWEDERKKFLSRVDDYKKDLAKIPQPPKEIIQKIPVKKVKRIKIEALPESFIIEGALDLPIKDQGKRPTCASFAGVRSIEILLNKQNKYTELSEQYFYYSSKPECKTSPCSNGGSWVFNGFENSKKSSQFDIPREKDCSYVDAPKRNNETQIPLENGCQQGVAKVEDYVFVKNNDAIISELKAGHPVIVGAKLSENFYTNKGHVFLKDASGAGLDSHANGHAIVFVGFIKLPQKLHASEGRFCFVSANSWGLGWGRGGHSCLSEKWFDRFKFDMNFIALSSVKSR